LRNVDSKIPSPPIDEVRKVRRIISPISAYIIPKCEEVDDFMRIVVERNLTPQSYEEKRELSIRGEQIAVSD